MRLSKVHELSLWTGLAAFLPLLAIIGMLSLPAVASAQWPTLTGPRARADLGDGNPQVRAAAAHTLGYHGAPRQAVDALAEALPTERDPVVRRALILALARRGESAAEVALIEALAATGTAHRALAARVLGGFSTEATVHALTDALEDEEVDAAAGGSLVRLGPRAVPHLILTIRRQPVSTAALAAIAILGEVGDHRAVPVLVHLLADAREPVQTNALGALGAMGAERAGPTVAGLLDDDSPEVRLAAIGALGVVGGPPHFDRLAAFIREDTGTTTVGDAAGGDTQDPTAARAQQRVALRALVALSPRRAIPHLERLAAEGSPAMGPLAVDLVLGLRVAGAAPLLHGLLAEGTRAEEAASALAELEGGSGLAVLVHAARGEPADSGVLRAIAVCLRRHARFVEDQLAEDAYRALARRSGDRAVLLRAIARDDSVQELIARRLESEDPQTRSVAALAAEVHPGPSLAEALTRALAGEEDAEAFRRIASALLRYETPVDPGDLGRLALRFEDPNVAPEAMLLAAAAYGDADRWAQRRLGRALRAGLRSPDPRVRTGAAWALARADDKSARRALAVALDDPAQEVRHGAARALSSLGVGAMGAAVLRRYRIEEDVDVAQALLDSVNTRRAFPAHGLRGDQVLRIRIVPSGATSSSRIPVDVVLPDGRYLRMNTLPTGELLLVDLPAGTADVRVRIGDTT